MCLGHLSVLKNLFDPLIKHTCKYSLYPGVRTVVRHWRLPTELIYIFIVIMSTLEPILKRVRTQNNIWTVKYLQRHHAYHKFRVSMVLFTSDRVLKKFLNAVLMGTSSIITITSPLPQQFLIIYSRA